VSVNANNAAMPTPPSTVMMSKDIAFPLEF
jgi:hypothetical protein